MKLFVSWSGGKDSALAAYRAWQQGHHLAYLLNCAAEDGSRVRAHGFPAEVVALQARAMGIPLVQVYTSWEDYEANFKDALRTLKASGVEGGVFGDMDIEEHREWVERVCAEVGMRPLLPLWKAEPWALLEEFWKAGFRALVVATRLGPAFLGRFLDRELVAEMEALGAHPCGERGEYHTLVTDGPLFRRPLQVKCPAGAPHIYEHEGHWFLNLTVRLENGLG
ncbi:MAG: diphthine--ammonia ligase [Anaerolineae bacterium]|nr:diphthine--ammonia ligase [Anaerolineae bacterium]MCX8067208.1 diphthine--ammonia ligase [Anaerolineae bacterium]MDW7990810.1 diphthine--ammonia ligase [Anaerolineae bacterium]